MGDAFPAAAVVRVREAIAFVAVGAAGFAADAALTAALVQFAGLPPLVARPPAVALAIAMTFSLNRTVTFRAHASPIGGAALRYLAVAAAGALVNYVVYGFVLAIRSEGRPGAAVLALAVATGSLAGMGVTYFGFRRFAFRATA